MSAVRIWLDKWRTGIRLSETAVVLGLWGGGIAAGDIVIAETLLGVGLLVALLAVASDPTITRARVGILLTLILCTFLSAEAIFLSRRAADSHAFSKKEDENSSYLIDVSCEAPSALELAPKSFQVTSIMGGDMGKMSFPIKSPPMSMNKAFVGLQCTIANLSELPIYNIIIPRSGRVGSETHHSVIRIRMLAPRPDRSFAFAIQQTDKASGTVSFFGPISAIDVDGNAISNIKLTKGSEGPFFITPHMTGLLNP